MLRRAGYHQRVLIMCAKLHFIRKIWRECAIDELTATRRATSTPHDRKTSHVALMKQVGESARLLALFVFLAGFSAGCANVAAYERGKLAHPTMSPSDASSVARDHVYGVQEGAMGGTEGAASGCGCN
jgi:hypothetical protein